MIFAVCRSTYCYCDEYDRVIKAVDAGGGVAYNVYGMNLISRELNSVKAYYLYNGRGDVTGLVNASGVVIASYYYDAFGIDPDYCVLKFTAQNGRYYSNFKSEDFEV